MASSHASINIECNRLGVFPADIDPVSCVIRNSTIPYRFNETDLKLNNFELVSELHFTKCLMGQLPLDIANYFPNLQTLSIFHSELRIISQLNKLKYLNYYMIVGNKIPVITKSSFSAARSLTEVIIIQNNVQFIERGALNNLTVMMDEEKCEAVNSETLACESIDTLGINFVMLETKLIKNEIRYREKVEDLEKIIFVSWGFLLALGIIHLMKNIDVIMKYFWNILIKMILKRQLERFNR